MSIFDFFQKFIKKMEIIFTYNNNIINLSCLTIEEHLSKNYIIKKTIDYNEDYPFLFMKHYSILKYIYYLYGYFIPINITFINIIPYDIDKMISFYSNTKIKFKIITNDKFHLEFISQYNLRNDFIDSIKKYNNIKFYIFENYQNVLKCLIFKYSFHLNESQIYFFHKISECEYITENTKNILLNIKKYFDFKNFNTSLFYDISFEGSIIIDLFLEEVNKKID
jgi:hypothetical protein